MVAWILVINSLISDGKGQTFGPTHSQPDTIVFTSRLPKLIIEQIKAGFTFWSKIVAKLLLKPQICSKKLRSKQQ
jgi:hypothetical protein